MRRIYLIFAFVAFVAWMILEKIDSEFKWIFLGFGGALLLFGIFMKEKIKAIGVNQENKDAI